MSVTVDGTNCSVIFPGTISGQITLSATPASGVHYNLLPNDDGTLLLLRTNNTIIIPSNGGGSITLSAPNIPNNVNFVFPPTEGLPGQVLQTDGAGNTSWDYNGVYTWSGGTTGMLPNTPTMGNVVMSGTLNIANGGTGITSFGSGVQAALGINVNTANGFGVLNNFGVLNIAQGGTGGSTANIAFNNLAPAQAGKAGYVLTTDSSNTSWTDPTSILVTSFSAGTTGLLPNVPTTGNIVLSGILDVDNGGTGITSLGAGVQAALQVNTNSPNGIMVANASGVLAIAQGGTGANNAVDAANNLLPSQAGNANKVLKTDGAGNLSWVENDAFMTVGFSQIYSGTTGSILIQTGTTLQEIVMGSGVAAALAQATNGPNGIMVGNASGVLSIAQGGTGLSALGTGVQTALSQNMGTANGFAALDGTGVLPITQGGTGANTAAAAANNLLPAQSLPAGKVLASDGAGNLSWVNNDSGLTVNTTQIASGTTGSILTQTGTTLTEIVMGTSVATALGTAANTNGGMMLAGPGGVLPIAQGGTGLSALGTGVQTALSQNMGTANGFAQLNGSGALPYTQGGTGMTTLGTAGQVPSVDPTGTFIQWSTPTSGLTVGTTQIASGTTGSLLTQTGTTLTETVMGTNVNAALAIATNTANGFPTQATTFTSGSVIYYNGTQLAENNANFFWNNASTALSIGTTSAPTVTGAKLRVETDAQINGLTIGLGGGQTSGNTAIGLNALLGNSGTNSTVVGGNAGGNNTGISLTAIGVAAGSNNTGNSNTALGAGTFGGGSGAANTAVGASAMATTNTGAVNTAVGVLALTSNSSGSFNTAIGSSAGQPNSTGSYNTCVGYASAFSAVGSDFNTAVGYRSLANATGDGNVVLGYNSGSAITTGSYNCILGGDDGGTGSLINQTGSNWIILSDGASNTAAWTQTTVPGWYQFNNSASWSVVSDERLKENIVDLKGSREIIKALRSVEFDMKDGSGHEIGWIAQEYQKVLPKQVHEMQDGHLSITPNLMPYVIALMNEMMDEIDSLKAQLAGK